MLVLFVLNELKDLVYHNFIKLDEEFEDENFRVIVIYSQQNDKKQID
jgi:hypothetical protein